MLYKDADKILILFEKELFNDKNKKDIILSRKFCNFFPEEPAVYIIFRDDRPVYAGETGKIRGRMLDLLNTRHHVFRRNLGKHVFSSRKNYHNATTRIRFPDDIEEDLNHYIEKILKFHIKSVNLEEKKLKNI